MVEFTIGKNEEGKRVDAVAMKLLPGAGKGFIYKMLRKKNIVVNDKKADGSERVAIGDVIRLYLSDETYKAFGGAEIPPSGQNSFHSGKNDKISSANDHQAGRQSRLREEFRSSIIYEDEDIMLVNKPAGMLSQKAEAEDISVNDLIIEYLLEEGKTNRQALRTFRPSVCNRLDRNTSGIVCAGISLRGSRELTRLIRDRKADKYYLCIVRGEVVPGSNDADGNKFESSFHSLHEVNNENVNLRKYSNNSGSDKNSEHGKNGEHGKNSIRLRSYLSKDEKTNIVNVRDKEFPGSVPVEIEYRPVKTLNGYTLLEVKLITGKSHQIRAQLAHIGHPIAGDPKYGDKAGNDNLRKKYGIRRQLLTAYSFEFPQDTVLENVKGKAFITELPDDFFIRP
ncbi:MAG: RluA family pseudouridine synthase [Lachnospiraceae bacterium]|nr:RluA family pseudouridine synthase [Lachnospiraceae bacterium]